MAEYIERDLVIENVIDQMKHSSGESAMRERILNLPTADVVPVVRCADCKWFQCNMRWDGYLPDGVSEYECRHWCGPCDPTDYCSHGAKMDKEETNAKTAD